MIPSDKSFYGIAEIGEALGVPRQTVAQWYRRDRLPEPDQVLRMGPLWIAQRIEPWIESERERVQEERGRLARAGSVVFLLLLVGMGLHTRMSKLFFHRALDRNDVSAIERATLRFGNSFTLSEGLAPIFLLGLAASALAGPDPANFIDENPSDL